MGDVSRREFLMAAGSLAMSLAMPGHGSSRESGPPTNFVVIFTDDQGYGDVGCYGAQGFETPNLDRMAAQGVRFTSFYVPQAVCSASRAGLLTGCYSNRVGILGALFPNDKIGISDDERTIADVLKAKGYATAAFGKWHLGHHPPFLPLRHGFDEYLGLPYSNDMWPIGLDDKPVTEGYWANGPPLPLIEGNETVRHIETHAALSDLTTLYTEHAVRFIENHHREPFFLYVPHSMPHVPLAVSDKFRGKSLRGLYGDVMMEIDWSAGEILRALERHDLAENTLVVFTCDNGPWLNYGNHAGSAGGLREGKGTSWEGGVRVPCIMRWPGRIPPGSVCHKMASTIDLLPTFAGIAGASLPPNRIDGVDILPLLKGEPGAEPRTRFAYYYGRPLQCVRENRWKLHLPHTSLTYKGHKPGKDGRPGPTGTAKTGYELYDLENDVAERRDVLADHPELAERLKAYAEEVREDLGDQDRQGKGIRPPGRVD